MTTYGVMKSTIADEIVRDDLSTQIGRAVINAIKQWEVTRFHFNEKRYRILTVAGQEYYDLITPTLLTSSGGAVGTGETLIELDSITCTISAGQKPYPLTERTQQWMDDNQSSSYQGQPDSYGFFGDQLRIYPIPNGVFTLNLSTLARLATLSADADTNAWMTDGEVLIREHAKMILYRDVLRDPDGETNASKAVVEAEWALKRRMAAKVATGTMRAWRL